MCTVVQPIRKLKFEKVNTFTHSFSVNDQIETVLMPLVTLISMLIDGNNFEDEGFSQASLTCTQLILSNAYINLHGMW